jgi:hypothetical protein
VIEGSAKEEKEEGNGKVKLGLDLFRVSIAGK